MATFIIKRNDRKPDAVRIVTDSAGAVVDLTTATSAKFIMADSSGAVVVNATASITDAAAGEITYSWAAADTDTAGTYKAEWEVNWSGSLQTFPVGTYDRVRIVEDLA